MVDSVYILGYVKGQVICVLVVYYDGNYQIDVEGLVVLWVEDCIVFIYVLGINGLVSDIVGVLLVNCCVLGMMLYFEWVVDDVLGGCDGVVLFVLFVNGFVMV